MGPVRIKEGKTRKKRQIIIFDFPAGDVVSGWPTTRADADQRSRSFCELGDTGLQPYSSVIILGEVLVKNQVPVPMQAQTVGHTNRQKLEAGFTPHH